jgi:hypothetical protein
LVGFSQVFLVGNPDFIACSKIINPMADGERVVSQLIDFMVINKTKHNIHYATLQYGVFFSPVEC